MIILRFIIAVIVLWFIRELVGIGPEFGLGFVCGMVIMLILFSLNERRQA